jgi:hypothetical protein
VNNDFYVPLTVHHDVNQFSVTSMMHLGFYSVICILHYHLNMFRALQRLSSGGLNCIMHHLVSLPTGCHATHWLKVNKLPVGSDIPDGAQYN